MRADIAKVVAELLRVAPYWAPEVKTAKLCDYLNAFGEPLYEALSVLPEDDRVVLGFDKVRRAVVQ